MAATLEHLAFDVQRDAAMTPRTAARLDAHKAVLARLGIADLSALGTLTIEGPVVARPGLTAAPPTTQAGLEARATAIGAAVSGGEPDAFAAPIYGPAVLVEGVQRLAGVDENGKPKLVELSEPARTLLATPTNEIALDTAYWAADTIELADGTTVVLRQPHKFLFVIARRLIVGKDVLFTWEKSAPAGGLPTKPPTPPYQPTVLDESGRPGADGRPGTPGGKGPDGKDAAELELWLLELQGKPGFLLDGQTGFDGGPGGDGGAAGGGSNGSPERRDWIGACAAGPGWGGRGGRGGPGGPGGVAGTGGHGGAIDIYAPAPVVISLAAGFYGDISGGKAGTPGPGGRGGDGGRAGSQGWCYYCCPAVRRDGQAGLPGDPGQPGGASRDGASYDGSPGTRNGRTLNILDEADFLRELTNAAIQRVMPEWAAEGDTATVEGLRFLPDDEVVIDGAAVATTYLSDVRLSFRVPLVAGGRHEVRVRRSDGNMSRSRGTLSIRPVLRGTDPAGRLQPGSTVTLVGSGLAPDAGVTVNGEQMKVVGFEGPDRLAFTLRRPQQIRENPEGEDITIRVRLGTGEPSNELAAVLDTFSMVVLGDSVAWGQGLRDEEKYHTLVADYVAATRGGQRVYRTHLAHSGAVIGVCVDPASEPKAPVHGEVPTARPTILEQAEVYGGPGDSRSASLVDLVLITGSINDVDIEHVLNPLTSPDEVARLTDQHCYWSMRTLLDRVTERFPNATVIVTGYYPIISERSDLRLLQAVLVALGLAIDKLIALGLTLVDIKTRSVNNMRTFLERSTARLQAAVEHTNDALGGGRRVRLAVPDFSAVNAALAPEPWVFALNDDLSTQDPAVYPDRLWACEAYAGRTGFHCRWASVGHPNPRGAQAYADAIRLALDGAADPLAELPGFPAGFLWGAADSAYQVEGGIEGNDWHHFTTTPAIVARVAAVARIGGQAIKLVPAGDALRHADLGVLRRDSELADLLGLNSYRLSLEWSRLQPTRPTSETLTDADFDPAALRYYDAVLDELHRRGLEPVVTLNHLSLPLWACTPPAKTIDILVSNHAIPLPVADGNDPDFQASLRGWESAETVQAFVAFAEFLARRYKDRVRYWVTLNEPTGSMVGLGYVGGVWPPGFNDGERAKRALFNLIRAHVRAYDAIKAVAPGTRVGLVHAMQHARVTANQLTSVLGDPWAARNQFEYFTNWHFLNAILQGRIDKAIHRREANQDLVKADELAQWFGFPIAGTQPWTPRADFIGLNYYRSVRVFYHLVISAVAPFVGGGFVNDLHAHDEEPHFLLNDLGWEISPEGLYLLLTALHERYGVPVMITENGVAEAKDGLRAAFITAHLQQILRAIKNGVDVLGYLHWTFIDNWELHEGFRPESRFGLFGAELPSNAGGARRLSRGALAYQQVIAEAGVEGAVQRFGAISPGGDRVRPAARSAMRTWEAKLDSGEQFTLVLGRLRSGELHGSLFLTGLQTWLPLENVRWDAAGGRLRFEHAGRPGRVGARAYDVTPSGRDLTGTCTENGVGKPWEATLVLHAGTWLSPADPRVIEIDRLEGRPGGWTAKYLTPGPDATWRHIPNVDSYGSTLELRDEHGAVFTGLLDGDTLTGMVRIGDDSAIPWQGSRAPDGLPFGPGVAPDLPVHSARFTDAAVYTTVQRTTRVDPAHLVPGQTAWVVVHAINTGSATWRRAGDEPTQLATDDPHDRPSPLVTPTWLTPSRPAVLKEAAVPTGALGTFEFPIHAPAAAGSLDERFALVTGAAWHVGTPLQLSATVRAPTKRFAALLADVRVFRDRAETTPASTTGMAAGETAWVTVRMVNLGSATWQSQGAQPVQLATDEPRERPSALAAPPWISVGRPGPLTEDTVPSGAVGTFRFPIIAPSGGGPFDERFRPVADGVASFEGDDVALVGSVVAPPITLSRYAWTPEGHAAYTDSSKTQPVDLQKLTPGQAAWVVLRAVNTGASTWTRAGANPVLLGTDGPPDHASALATPAWPSPNRAARLTEDAVATGGSATFEFPITAPRTGVLEERFRPVADPLARLDGPDYALHLAVVGSTASKRILVQARHQAPLEPGQSGGGPGSGELEAAIQARLMRLLQADGRFVSTAAPGDLPDRLDVDLGVFLSLDAAAKPQAGGYYFAFPTQQPASAELAGLLAEEIGSVPGRPNRRADNNPQALASYFGFARLPAGVPKVLVQHGFVTNPVERQWIAAHVDELARAEYRALCRFLTWEPRATRLKRVMVQARHQAPLEPGQGAGGPEAGSFEAALQQRLSAWLSADTRFDAQPYPGALPTSVETDVALVLSVDAAANAQSGGYYFAYPNHAPSKKLATLVAEEIAALPDRPGRREDNNPASLAQYFGFGRLPADVPRVLVQHGFTTKPAERAWLSGHVDALARAEYRALCRFLELQPLERLPT